MRYNKNKLKLVHNQRNREELELHKAKKAKYLKNIYRTKKSRINTAQRLLDSYWFTQFTMISFSVLLIILTLLTVKEGDYKSIILLGTSVIVAIFSVYGTAKNFQERHIRMKDNYVKLGLIEAKLDRVCSNRKDILEIDNIIQEYNALLTEVENHDVIDYLKSKIDDDKGETSFITTCHYIWLKFLYSIPKVAVVALWFGVLGSFLVIE